jgi:ABC-type phosphate/phosphonate transport system substrate-binding protein
MTFRSLKALSLVLGLALFAWLPAAATAQSTAKPIKVGMVKEFFNDLPKSLIDIAIDPFKDVMKLTTGLEGELIVEGQVFDVAQKVRDGKVDLGVFHGHEFAWVQKKYPELKPMMVAVNKHNSVKALIIVNQKNTASKIADLRGQKIDVPMLAKQHTWICLGKHCGDNNAAGDPKSFFGAIVRSDSVVDALDEVARGKVQAALVDSLWLETYRREKGPVFDKHLRILHEESFLPPVIAFKEGGLEMATLNKVRDGLAQAATNRKCADLLDMWQIKGFEPLPANFTQGLADMLKAYPSPEPSKISMR